MNREPIQKHSLNLREGDYEYLSQVFSPHSVHVSFVIRRLISRYVDDLRSKEGATELDLGRILL